MCDTITFDQLHRIRNELRSRASTHPYLVTIWSRALDKNIERLRCDLESAEKALHCMNNYPDLSPEQVTALCLTMIREPNTAETAEHGLNGQHNIL